MQRERQNTPVHHQDSSEVDVARECGRRALLGGKGDDRYKSSERGRDGVFWGCTASDWLAALAV